jgi:ABC-2 type transport system permease protein
MRLTWVIVRKEWSEVFKNRLVLFTVSFLPLMLALLPLLILVVMGSGSEMQDIPTSDIPSSFLPLCGDLQGGECLQYYLVSQFMLLFMMIPLAIPVTIATHSIVGEKITRTLEPVLATPISTLQLLAGKALAAVIPAVLATWAGFGVFALSALFLSATPAVASRLGDPLWLMAIFLVGPLLSIASVSVAVMVSSRTTEPRVAEQLSMLVMLPLLGVFFSTMFGLIVLNEQMILWMAAILLVLDAGLAYFSIRVFQRETILTRWK